MPHPKDLSVMKKITTHHNYAGSKDLKYPLIYYTTDNEDRKENKHLITVAAAYVAMRSNIPIDLWSTFVLNPALDIDPSGGKNPFIDSVNFEDLVVVSNGVYARQGQWNGTWLILSHGGSGHIHINEDLTASQFYTKFAADVMQHPEHKATVIASCYSGNLENLVRQRELKKKGDKFKVAEPFIVELQGYCKPAEQKRPIIAAGKRMTCLFPRDSTTHFGCLCIEPSSMVSGYRKENREDFLRKYFKVEPEKAEVIFEHPWVGSESLESESLESESLESEAKEDKDEGPFKDEITGLTGYGYQDCLTEEFYRDKTINVCDILDALVKPKDNHSDGKDPDINQLPTDTEELKNDKSQENAEEKIEEFHKTKSSNATNIPEIPKNIHRIPDLELEDYQRYLWFYTDPDKKFPIIITNKAQFSALVRRDAERRKIYKLRTQNNETISNDSLL